MPPAPIRTVGTRVPLFFGGDRNVVLTTLLLASASILTGNPFTMAMAYAVWVAVVFAARRAAKIHPRYFAILWRATMVLNRYYPARPSPHREAVKVRRWWAR